MNELIRKLSVQAGEPPTTKFPNGYFSWEKFAELIVRECIDAVENSNDRYRRDYFADKIRERFGIER